MPYLGSVPLTNDWTDVVSHFTPDLSVGADYLIVNTSSRLVEIIESSSTPDDRARGIPIEPGEKWILTPDSGIAAYARTPVSDVSAELRVTS